MELRRPALAGLILLLLCACPSPTGGGGDATTIAMSCKTGERRYGACSVNLGVMENHYRLELQHPNFEYYKSNIKISARLTVGKGVVKVWFHDDGSTPKEVIVRPGQPAELSGIAHVYSLAGKNTLDLYFQVVNPGENGKAENVQAEIEYLM
jgi:hypothetical protein